ncbi:methylmalonyl-CoA mutase, N-terminal domain [Desulfosarcina sp. BuS5]|uniref:acyl-CoA mutase large subunit family protein n=1 Tax=Desulfosarcina sp. BuS5 TaxID=933262 RepID=UPI000483BD20|nr:methylmalonyl-CoA mutase family protein [Desulfosarcina sp. BuS5]WDN90642.1 methylmalonyl-CoA mutase, N-terminal domain [Desulfosarcina sp. BuS5]
MTVLEDIAKEKERWKRELLNKKPYKKDVKPIIEGVDENVEVLFTPADIQHIDYNKDIGFPGEYPFTRGAYPSMYRGRLWTMRQYAGCDSADESNARYKYLIEQGNMGLSVAFDLPTQMGYDSDNEDIKEEIGRVGVAISSLKDMEILFDGIDLGKVTTSFTINGIAPIILAMYVAAAEKQGVPREKVGGTVQNDILKEYVARGTYIFPPKPSVRLIADSIVFCMKEVPRFNAISISGGHYRSGGASLIQELAFMMLNGIEYIQTIVDRGIDVDDFAPRLSYLVVNHVNLFEEVAKHRAARKLWASIMKERFGAKDPKSMMFRVFSAGCGDELTHAEPENNIIRLTLMTLGGVLGGVQSYFTPAYDEAYAIPTEKTALLGLRTQQIIAHESGVANTVDPLAGSYYIEWLTDLIEKETRKYMVELESKGTVIELIEKGYIQSEMARVAYDTTKAKMSGEHIVVGVNKFAMEGDIEEIQIHQANEEAVERQIARVKQLKKERDNVKVGETLKILKVAAEGTDNMMPLLINAVKAYATVEEIVATLKNVFGEFVEPV